MQRAEAGDYQGALVMFKRALALQQRSDIQCNVGSAYYKLAQWAEAHLYLGQCLSRTADLNDAEFVRVMSEVYASTERRLRAGEYGAVEFDITPKHAFVRVSTLPGDVSFQGSRTVWLPSGDHQVEITAPGHADARGRVVVAKGVVAKPARFQLARLVQKTPPEMLAASRVQPPSSRTGAVVAMAAGGVALTTGVVFFLLARDTAQRAEPLTASDPQRDELRSQFRFRRVLAYSALGLGTVGIAIGGYLFVRSRSTKRPIVAPTVSSERVMVWSRWQY